MPLNVTVIRLVQIKLVVNVSFKPFLSFFPFITIIVTLGGSKGKGK